MSKLDLQQSTQSSAWLWVLGTFIVVATIAGSTIFFISSEEASKRTPASDQKPESAEKKAGATRALSQISLALAGISHRNRAAVALITIDRGPALPYAIDDEVVAGIRVRAIASNHVVITQGSQSRVLYLEAGAQQAKVASVRPVRAPSTDYPFTKNPDIDPLSLNTTHLGAAQEFLREVKVARMEDGGFLVQEVDPESLYEKMGLRPGDIVHNMDVFAKYAGSQESRLMGIYAGDAELQIVRDGAVVILTHQPE